MSAAPARDDRGSIRVVFVANRGEIAGRIERTATRLGLAVVRPDTSGPDALDLLDGEAVIAAAAAAGADAIHPGYGFLAENAEFAAAVVAAGIRWIGPPAAAIRAMGDKAAARRLATELGVPVLPGYDDEDQSDAALTAAAERIGRPLLVKPSAGGGGKGMHVVRDRDVLADVLATARREALASFGDARLILERFLDGPRHVEIQVLFDAHGAGVHLGERDCSTQRRHQKVLEESLAPSVTADLREAMGAAALRLAGAVGYVSAGTVEFLLDDAGRFVFLEMNTRLQVEHPVTELVTGRDLVADQLRIAAGERLGFGQADVRFRGHAIEARLYAEDAEAGFLPATGRIEALRWPAGEGVRVDAGIEPGDVVGGRFDPMLAKLIAWGPDRAAALARLTAALDETVVLGLVTNLRFLRWLLRRSEVRRGAMRVDSLERIWSPPESSGPVVPDDAWRAAATLLTTARAVPAGSDSAPDSMEAWSGGWRLNAPATVRVVSDGVERRIELPASVVASGAADRADVHVVDAAGNGRNARAAVVAGSEVHLDVDGRSVTFGLAPPPDVDRAARAASTQHGLTVAVTAPMPGTVVAVHARSGSEVEAGDPILTLEAMKMEHVVAAPVAGAIADLDLRAGDQVVRGQPLATIRPPAAA